MLSGTMIHLAMQAGLHRPSQTQDFSQFSVKLEPEELRDRITTWTTCRIVAQWYVSSSFPLFFHFFFIYLYLGFYEAVDVMMNTDGSLFIESVSRLDMDSPRQQYLTRRSIRIHRTYNLVNSRRN
jgi:hypothetical protein